jgi:hypothetical protein
MAQITGRPSPLTPQQLGLLVEGGLSFHPGLNVIQIVIRFEDEVIDLAALFAAWSDLAARHETLRLSMDPFGADGPCQTVAPSVCLQLGEDDWQAHAPADPTDDWFAPRLDAWLRADRQRGITFEQAPAWRVRRIEIEGRGSFDFDLQPVEVFAPGARVVIDEGTPTPHAVLNRTRHLRGRVRGMDDSLVAVSVAPDGTITGLLNDGEVTWELQRRPWDVAL